MTLIKLGFFTAVIAIAVCVAVADAADSDVGAVGGRAGSALQSVLQGFWYLLVQAFAAISIVTLLPFYFMQ